MHTSTVQKIKDLLKVGKRYHEVVTHKSESGSIQTYLKPLMLQFHFEDVLQAVAGATILAFPVSMTDEVIRHGTEISTLNAVILALFSISFIAMFVYHNFYRRHIKDFHRQFVTRVLGIYIITLGVVATFLILLGLGFDGVSNIISFKRMILIAFPASLGAAVADMVK